LPPLIGGREKEENKVLDWRRGGREETNLSDQSNKGPVWELPSHGGVNSQQLLVRKCTYIYTE